MLQSPESPPQGPLGPKHVRIIKISIAVMTALIILGLIGLFYGIARQASKMGANPKSAATVANADAPYRRNLSIGEGQVGQLTAGQGFLALQVKKPAGDEVIIIEPQSGKEIGRITLGK